MGGGCPNECSSHGYCRAHGKCFCFAGWAGFDCAQRECAFGKAWGVNDGIHQRPVECSYKGVCDRGSGECQCFEGYEGPACERTTCPNDCSGHGKCRYISELPLVPAGLKDDEWEANRIQTCVCDGGYFGADCSLRYCPRGDDPQTICDAITGMTQTMTFEFQNAPDMPTLEGDKLAITIVTNNGERFTTAPITGLFAASAGGYSDAENLVVSNAIKAIPNFAALDISTAMTLTGTSLSIAVTFNGQTSTGDQPLMECLPEMNCNSDGCVPKVSLLDVDATAAGTTYGVTLDTPARLYGFDTNGDMISGVKVRVIVLAGATSFTYEITKVDATGTDEASDGVVTLPLPSQTSKKMDIGYGLQLSFNSANYGAGTALWAVHIPACSVAYTTYADPSSENAECSNRGLCDRSSGLCSCFDGFAGAGCEDQVIVI